MKEIQISVKSKFSQVQHSVKHLAVLGFKAFEKQAFSNLAYSEPVYVKEFFTHQTVTKN